MSRKLRLRLGFDDNALGSVLPAKIAMAHSGTVNSLSNRTGNLTTGNRERFLREQGDRGNQNRVFP
jgi:hypothetical protein